jgi:hypothetical protein
VELLGVMGQVESRFGPSGDVVSVGQYRCLVNAESTIGSKIVLDEPMALLGDEAQLQCRFLPFGDSANLDVR